MAEEDDGGGSLDVPDLERERALGVLRLKQRFLAAFETTGVQAWAARQVGTSTMQVWRWRRDDAEFAAAYEEAGTVALARLEKEAVRRAMVGTKEPIYYQGKRVGYVRTYSDALLIFLLKARDPDTYRETREVRAAIRARMEVTPAPTVEGEPPEWVRGLSAATLDAIAGVLAADDGDGAGDDTGTG